MMAHKPSAFTEAEKPTGSKKADLTKRLEDNVM